MLTRRKFLSLAGVASGAVALTLVPVLSHKPLGRVFRIRLRHPELCSPGHVAFCRRAEFASARAALRAASIRDVEAEVFSHAI